MAEPTVLALDVSTKAVGWCLAHGQRHIDSGTYEPGDAHDAWGRIALIDSWVCRTLFLHWPEVVAVELPIGSHGNPLTDLKLGAAIGVILSNCNGIGIEFQLIHQATVKATGFHKGARCDVALLIGQDDHEQISEHQADAIGVWQAFLVGEKERRLIEQSAEMGQGQPPSLTVDGS